MGLLDKLAGLFQSNNIGDTPPKLGRNDQCWCGSGKKYKKCCLEADEKKQSRSCAPSCGPT